MMSLLRVTLAVLVVLACTASVQAQDEPAALVPVTIVSVKELGPLPSTTPEVQVTAPALPGCTKADADAIAALPQAAPVRDLSAATVDAATVGQVYQLDLTAIGEIQRSAQDQDALNGVKIELEAQRIAATPATASLLETNMHVGVACTGLAAGVCKTATSCDRTKNSLVLHKCAGPASIACCLPLPGKIPSKATTKPSTTSGAGVTKFLSLIRSKIGAKYVFGAEGPNTFDCSGLVNWAAKQAGVKIALGRTADDLSRQGVAITNVADRKPGDLIFFGKQGVHVHHVGVYVSPHTMIDAPHTGAFVRQELYTYWPDALTLARRIF